MNRQSNKTTALYCRIDGGKYIPHSFYEIMSQQEILIHYAKTHGLENPCIFSDCGYCGTTLDRPEFQHMLHEVEAGNIAAIVVTNFARLIRDNFKHGFLVDETLPQYGVALHSVEEGIYSPALSIQCRQAILSMWKGGWA